MITTAELQSQHSTQSFGWGFMFIRITLLIMIDDMHNFIHQHIPCTVHDFCQKIPHLSMSLASKRAGGGIWNCSNRASRSPLILASRTELLAKLSRRGRSSSHTSAHASLLSFSASTFTGGPCRGEQTMRPGTKECIFLSSYMSTLQVCAIKFGGLYTSLIEYNECLGTLDVTTRCEHISWFGLHEKYVNLYDLQAGVCSGYVNTPQVLTAVYRHHNIEVCMAEELRTVPVLSEPCSCLLLDPQVVTNRDLA